MPDIKRTADAEWKGDLKSGEGHFSSTSGAFKEVAYSFATRFENSPGSNPEELLAAAHAACYSMAFSATLSRKGIVAESIKTHATCIMTPAEGGGFRISKMVLQVTGRVPGIDEQTFKEIAKEADKGCPVSNLLRSGLEIEIRPTLG